MVSHESFYQFIGKGHKQAIVSLTERKSRLTLIAKVKRKSAELLSRSIQHLLMPIVSKVFTLTSDDDWERELDENTNGLIHQYFPKKHDVTTITEKAICYGNEQIEQQAEKMSRL